MAGNSTMPTTPTTSRRAFVGFGGALAAAAALSACAGEPARPPAADPMSGRTAEQVHHRTENLDGVDIFYREAGPREGPVVLLLHGIPTSSRMFRNLIPMLADTYRVIAPDYPASGQSATPARGTFPYTFARFSELMDALLQRLQVTRFALYVSDIGGPIGYRLMLKYPDRLTGVVVQNAPAFGNPTQGPAWADQLAYWKDGSPAHRDAVRAGLAPDAVRQLYVAGTSDPSLIDPDTWTLDSALLARPGVEEIMLDLVYDIRNNRQTLSDAQRFFAAHQNQIMFATGAKDPLFPADVIRPPAELSGIEFHAVDAGHFALEDHYVEIGGLTQAFLARVTPA